MTALAAIDARLLGPLEFERERASIPLGTPGQRALLARLVLDANRTVAVDRLVEDLWGADVPPTAVKMVQIHVSRLRKLLPAGMLVTRSPGYAVEIEPEALDLVRFERLREQGRTALAAGRPADAAEHLRAALALWRGPALAEFDEPFAAVEAARLEELRLSCIEDRIDADLALGRHAELIGELSALVIREPLRERARTQLMLALYRSGRQAEALACYRDLRLLLTSELGLEPSPALRQLEHRILQHDAALELGPVSPTERCTSIASVRDDIPARRPIHWAPPRAPRRGHCRVH
jgi:DNA-binding SARP family transcriptional activator